jgi:hypothetical protein
MEDLDALLGRLARAPAPASLDGLEAQVLARIAMPTVVRVGIGMSALAVAAALVIGIIAAVPVRTGFAAGAFDLADR